MHVSSAFSNKMHKTQRQMVHSATTDGIYNFYIWVFETNAIHWRVCNGTISKLLKRDRDVCGESDGCEHECGIGVRAQHDKNWVWSESRAEPIRYQTTFYPRTGHTRSGERTSREIRTKYPRYSIFSTTFHEFRTNICDTRSAHVKLGEVSHAHESGSWYTDLITDALLSEYCFSFSHFRFVVLLLIKLNNKRLIILLCL